MQAFASGSFCSSLNLSWVNPLRSVQSNAAASKRLPRGDLCWNRQNQLIHCIKNGGRRRCCRFQCAYCGTFGSGSASVCMLVGNDCLTSTDRESSETTIHLHRWIGSSKASCGNSRRHGEGCAVLYGDHPDGSGDDLQKMLLCSASSCQSCHTCLMAAVAVLPATMPRYHTWPIAVVDCLCSLTMV